MRTALAAAVAAISLSIACARATPEQAPSPPDEAADLLHERVWLDKEPRGWGDQFHLMVFDGDHSGVYQDRTVWKGNFEVFIYEADGNTLDLRLPGSRKTMKTGFRIEKSKRGEADVKLTLDKMPAGPTTYYGYRFDGGGAATPDAWVKATFGSVAD
jgi:hypothetical protein